TIQLPQRLISAYIKYSKLIKDYSGFNGTYLTRKQIAELIGVEEKKVRLLEFAYIINNNLPIYEESISAEEILEEKITIMIIEDYLNELIRKKKTNDRIYAIFRASLGINEEFLDTTEIAEIFQVSKDYVRKIRRKLASEIAKILYL